MQGEHQNLIALINEDQEIIFNSFTDHFLSHLIFDLENLVVDICVPRDKEHYVVVRDQLGGTNGFQDGVLSIFVDRVLFETVQGDFGTEIIVTIPAQTSAAPTTAAAPSTETAFPTSQPTTAPTTLTMIPTVMATMVPATGPASAPVDTADVPSAAFSKGVASIGTTAVAFLVYVLFH